MSPQSKINSVFGSLEVRAKKKKVSQVVILDKHESWFHQKCYTLPQAWDLTAAAPNVWWLSGVACVDTGKVCARVVNTCIAKLSVPPEPGTFLAQFWGLS